MRQQLPYRNVVFSVLRKLGKVFCYRIIQADFALLDQLHDRCGGRDHFGEGCQIENRIQRHGLAPRLQRAIAVGLPINHVPVVPDQENGARNVAIANGLLDNGIDRVQMNRGGG